MWNTMLIGFAVMNELMTNEEVQGAIQSRQKIHIIMITKLLLSSYLHRGLDRDRGRRREIMSSISCK